MRKKYRYIDAAGNFTVSGFGKLHRVVVGTGLTNSVITLYNGTGTSDPVIATINAGAAGNYDFGGLDFSSLHVVMSAANSKATIVYS